MIVPVITLHLDKLFNRYTIEKIFMFMLCVGKMEFTVCYRFMVNLLFLD